MTDKLEKIGKYDIVSELGKGAMGVVYKGFDPVINRYVAIKTLSRHGTEADRQELAARFKQEAQAAGRLNHPGIVSVYDYGEEGDLTFIAMELVEGHTLSEKDRQNIRLSLEDIWDIMFKMLDALNYAHGKGVVHRDIKPSNIMRTAGGEVKITDFGIAHIDTSELTQFGTVIGTPGYMSPEQLMGQRVDHRSDIYSCGILFYELLTGERAFSGTNITSTIYKVVHTDLPPASKLSPTVPEAIDAVLSRALAKNPDQRFASALEFAQAINSVSLGANGTTPVGIAAAPNSDKTVIHQRTSPNSALQQSFAPQTDTNSNINPALEPSSGAGWEPPAATNPTLDPLQMLDSAHGVDAGVKPDPYNARKPALHRDKQPARKKPLLIAGAGALVIVALIASVLILAPELYDDFGQNKTPKPPAGDASKSAAPPVASSPPVSPAYRPGKRFKDCETCPEMIVVPEGSFAQGSPESELERQASEGPQRNVRIGYPLAIGLYEVSRQQFAQFATETGHEGSGCTTYEGDWKLRNNRNWQSPGFYQNAGEAVTCVSWNDARDYVEWLSGKTGARYRLLSASEWEYVARAGTQTTRSWGDNPDTACSKTNVADIVSKDDYPGWKIHNCMDGHLYTAPPDAFSPNDFGVYAMLGNLFEWTEDCWNDSYRGAPSDGSAWTEGDCNNRSMRGGSWFSQPQYVRSAFRNRFNPDTRASTFGIRVARELPSG